MKDISERAFPKGHFDEGHFEGRAFPKGERAKGMKGIVHKLEFSPVLFLLFLVLKKFKYFFGIFLRTQLFCVVPVQPQVAWHSVNTGPPIGVMEK